jgi:UDP-2,4-diacetamido-2,4,6-trideoxy-beta-L-altropyranose hydrolase
MKILFRADSSSAMGAGHVMRCLALAESALRKGHKPVFLSTQMLTPLKKRMQSKKIQLITQKAGAGSLEDAHATARLAIQGDYDCVVADHYGIGSKFQGILQDSGIKQLLLDDDGRRDAYRSDLVLNQNIYADKKMYKRILPTTRLLLGSRFALIRDEFLKRKNGHRPTSPKVSRLLVTMGGSDPNNVTLKVLNAIEQLPLQPLKITVVVGPGYKYLPELEIACKRSKFNTHIQKDPKSMAQWMAWADMAVSAAGSTSWELAYMGVPSILIIIADNQKAIGRTLHKKGAVLCAGELRNLNTAKFSKMLGRLMASYALRKKMSRVLRRIVDGRGSSRVLEALAA